MQTPADLAKQVKTHFDNRDYEALMRVINQALNLNPGGPGAGAQLRGIQGQLEDEKLREEFEIHVENLKSEAMKQFDQELYSECFGTFRFLCELEPDNRTLKGYLELCQQLVQGTVDDLLGQDAAKASDDIGVVRDSGEILAASESVAEPAPQEMSTSTLMAGSNLEPSSVANDLHAEPERNAPDHAALPSERQVSRTATAVAKSATVNEAPAVESLTWALRFGLVAVAFLLVSILGIAYLRGPIQTWKSLQEQRSTPSNTVPEASHPKETTSQLETQTLLLQKAEAAAALNHYVAPPGDNAVAYCNQALALDPANPKAWSLRESSVNGALMQTKKMIETRNFSAAREAYSSLLTSAQQESRFPLTAQEVKNQLDKLEFAVYSVVHDHLFGSCKGYLKINAYVISYSPSEGSTDGFTEPFSEVTLSGTGDRLKIEIRAKTYHFESNLGSKEQNRERVKSIFRDLKARMAKG